MKKVSLPLIGALILLVCLLGTTPSRADADGELLPESLSFESDQIAFLPDSLEWKASDELCAIVSSDGVVTGITFTEQCR